MTVTQIVSLDPDDIVLTVSGKQVRQIVSLDPDDIVLTVSGKEYTDVSTRCPDSPKRIMSKDSLSTRQTSTDSIVSGIKSRISSSSFKQLITDESSKREPPDASTALPFGQQLSVLSCESAVPDILWPMSPTRADDLITYCPTELEKRYRFQNIIGQGAFGIVRKAISKETKKVVAIKSIKMDDWKFAGAYSKECIVAWMCDHPFIVRLIECFSDDKVLHLVMDHLSGRTVNALVKSRQLLGEPRGLPAAMQEQFIWAMLSSISYLHHHQIAHRDCKSENFMQKSESRHAPLILVDFGLAVRYEKDTFLTEKVGTPEYAAPEVSCGSYNEKCDIWSIGIVGYMISVGFLPFIGKTAKQVMKKVRDLEVKWDPDNWDMVKPSLREIVQNMLVKDPQLRPSAKRLVDQNHGFFENVCGNSHHEQPKQCCTIS